MCYSKKIIPIPTAVNNIMKIMPNIIAHPPRNFGYPGTIFSLICPIPLVASIIMLAPIIILGMRGVSVIKATSTPTANKITLTI